MHNILHRMCWCLLISSQEKEKEEEEEENSEEEEEENQRHSLFERVAASVRSLSFRWEVDYSNSVYTCFYSLNQSSLLTCSLLSFLFCIYCTNFFHYSIVEFWLWYLLLIRFIHVPVPVIDQQNNGSKLVLEPAWLKALSYCFLNNLWYVCRQSWFQISNALFGRNFLQLI